MINCCFLHGNLGKDPKLSESKNGKSVCKFSLAVNRLNEGCDYFNVVAFGSLADACGKYLQKGSEVTVQGRLQSDTYEKNGVKQFYVQIVADAVDFGARTKSGQQETVMSQNVQQSQQAQTVQPQPQQQPQQQVHQQQTMSQQQVQQNLFSGDIDSICLP